MPAKHDDDVNDEAKHDNAAAPPAADLASAVTVSVTDKPVRRGPVCPMCDRRVERYAGDNAHKAGTGWCSTHGRIALDG